MTNAKVVVDRAIQAADNGVNIVEQQLSEISAKLFDVAGKYADKIDLQDKGIDLAELREKHDAASTRIVEAVRSLISSVDSYISNVLDSSESETVSAEASNDEVVSEESTAETAPAEEEIRVIYI